MKKYRGLKRYYRNLAVDNVFITRTKWLQFKPGIWFDYWHLHFDHYRLGNRRFKSRKLHLDKLFRHYELLVNESSNFPDGFQVWAFISENTSYDDGLYIHTPNPNKNEFPHKYSNYSLVSNFKNKNLDTYLEGLTDYKRIYLQFITDGESKIKNYCALYKIGVGESII